MLVLYWNFESAEHRPHYVVLVDGVEGTDELKVEIQDMVKHSLAFYEYPKRLEFRDELPMTPTGKIQRRLLRDPS